MQGLTLHFVNALAFVVGVSNDPELVVVQVEIVHRELDGICACEVGGLVQSSGPVPACVRVVSNFY